MINLEYYETKFREFAESCLEKNQFIKDFRFYPIGLGAKFSICERINGQVVKLTEGLVNSGYDDSTMISKRFLIKREVLYVREKLNNE